MDPMLKLEDSNFSGDMPIYSENNDSQTFTSSAAQFAALMMKQDEKDFSHPPNLMDESSNEAPDSQSSPNNQFNQLLQQTNRGQSPHQVMAISAKKRKYPANVLDNDVKYSGEIMSTVDNLDDVETSNDEKEVSTCIICHDKSSGVHYGVPACEGCKGFFRRIVTSTSPMTNMRCNSGNNQCVMSPSTRNTCQRCRLQKCFNVGMTRKRSKLGRRSKQCKAEPEVNPPRFSDVNRILSDEELLDILASESVNFQARTGPQANNSSVHPGASMSPNGNSSNEQQASYQQQRVMFKMEPQSGGPGLAGPMTNQQSTVTNPGFHPLLLQQSQQQQQIRAGQYSNVMNPASGQSLLAAIEQQAALNPTRIVNSQNTLSSHFLDEDKLDLIAKSTAQQFPNSSAFPDDISTGSGAGMVDLVGFLSPFSSSDSPCPASSPNSSLSRLHSNNAPIDYSSVEAMSPSTPPNSSLTVNTATPTASAPVNSAASIEISSDKLSNSFKYFSISSSPGGRSHHSSSSSTSHVPPPVAPIQLDQGSFVTDKEMDDMFRQIEFFFQTAERDSPLYLEFESLRMKVPETHKTTCIVLTTKVEEFFRVNAFNAPIESDNRKAWDIMLHNMAPVLHRVISFCKKLPGLRDSMEPHDTINVIKLCMFDIISLRFTRLVNLPDDMFYDPALHVKIPAQTMYQIPIGSIFKEYMYLAKYIEDDLDNQVDDPEMAFLSGYATTLPGRNLADLITCPEHLLKMRFLFAACLYDHLLVVKFRGDRISARKRARSLFGLMDRIKKVTKTHSEILMHIAQGPDHSTVDSLPLLLKQVFFDTLENESTLETTST